jgi:D-beta-D-heptose 7-phosphate kinase/D-beta-D-heptose 1-phosphate adenosyltransferase
MKSILEQFKNKNILVFGDVMLDRYWTGTVDRISPEAPVPVLKLAQESLVAGGAANVAANVAGLGANARLLSIVGHDEESVLLNRVLAEIGGVKNGLIGSPSRRTTVKSRVMAQHQQIVRVDSEDATELDETDTAAVCNAIDEEIISSSAVIVSDYGKGVVSAASVSYLIAKALELGIPVLIDPKGVDYEKYRGASVLTPNRKEALDVYHLESPNDTNVVNAGTYIRNKFGVENILVTLGADGMALFEGPDDPTVLNASARNVFDVTGAGDTVIAVLATAVASGADLLEGATIANLAAGKVVETVGTTAITIDSLDESVREFLIMGSHTA